MRLVLDAETAYEYWMYANPSVIYSPDNSPHQLLTTFDGFSSLEISQAIGKNEGDLEPIQLLVESAEERRNSRFVNCHVWARDHPLPARSVYEIGPGLYVISPELCLVRLAMTLPQLELLHALSNMLGLFAFSFWKRMDLVERPPITNVASIQRFLADIPGAKGVKALRRALVYVCERSRSPRESDVNLCLKMPARLGGQAMPPFEVNRKITLSDKARLLTTKTYLEGDVVWMKRKTVIEYNSDDWHLDSERMMSDLDKIAALQRMGMTVFPLSTWQFSNYQAFRSLVQGVRKSLGVRNQETAQMDKRRTYLHADLMEIERRERSLPVLSKTARWQFLEPRLDHAIY